jgi:hypothetical protein
MMTAIDWFLEELENNDWYWLPESIKNEIINQAKEIEKEQIMDAFWNGDNTDCTSEQNSKEFAEQYYNKTFKSK